MKTEEIDIDGAIDDHENVYLIRKQKYNKKTEWILSLRRGKGWKRLSHALLYRYIPTPVVSFSFLHLCPSGTTTPRSYEIYNTRSLSLSLKINVNIFGNCYILSLESIFHLDRHTRLLTSFKYPVSLLSNISHQER